MKHRTVHAKSNEWIHVKRHHKPSGDNDLLKIVLWATGIIFVLGIIKEFFWFIVLGLIGWAIFKYIINR